MTVKAKRDKSRLVVSGELDRFHLSDNALYQFQDFDQQVIIDLNAVSHIDTAGVAYLLKLVSHYQSQNKTVTISGASEQLIALANISNVLELLPLDSN